MFNSLFALLAIAGGIMESRAPAIGIQSEPNAETCLVSRVFPGSPAEQHGIQVGDEIVACGEWPVGSMDDLRYVLSRYSAGDSIPFWFKRDGQTMYVEITVRSRNDVLEKMQSEPEE